MRAAIIRSLLVALATLAAGAALDGVYLMTMCPGHRAWMRAAESEAGVVLDHYYGIARPGDALFLCSTDDHLGPLALHRDLSCYCAPASVGTDALSAHVNGQCVLDNPAPTRDDAFGACRHASCEYHLDP